MSVRSEVPQRSEVPTYCRICEALCGLIATVEDGKLISLAPDPDNPLSRGRVCPKGIAYADVQNDSDRVLTPLRRRSDGEFEPASWDDALGDIATRLNGIIAEHGGRSVGQYIGNPMAFNYSAALWSGLFMKRIGSRHAYSSNSQDVASRMVANKLLYGAATQMPFPDLQRTHFLLMIGANPLVSHGSAVRAPRVRDDLASITARGGRVVVVDPRRTETARHYEHLSIVPDSDAWLLLSLLHVVIAEALHDRSAIDRQSTGFEALARSAADFSPERTAARTGIDAETVRTLARDFAAAPTATAYGRTGTCLGRHGTVVSYLIDALTLITGNLDRDGGSLLSHAAIPLEDLGEMSGQLSYDTARSRIGDVPEVMGMFPATVMADEITTPGEGQLRAMFVLAGNPVLTVPNSRALDAALPNLDLMVSFDLYVTETNRHADWILPATTFLEREDFPFGFASSSPTLFVQTTERVLDAAGEARPEWTVYAELAERMGITLFLLPEFGALDRLLRPLGRLGKLVGLGRISGGITPRRLLETVMRTGPYGDRFGLRRGGLSPAVLRANPHGVVVAERVPTGRLREVVRHRGGKVCLDAPAIYDDISRLGETHPTDPAFPLLMIGIREVRSHNSFMHNSATLMKGDRRQWAHINPVDAAAAGVRDGDDVRIVTADGEICTQAKVTDDIRVGTVAVPPGWGHRGGWQRANAAGGGNVNELTSSRPDDLERLAGMSVLNGVAARIEAVRPER